MSISSHSSDEDHKRSGKKKRWYRGCPTRVFHAFLHSLDAQEEELPEVEHINNYAVFIGYLSMGVRGLGFLVVTWTTVVLLGGFVSVLEEKDFWCLTVITLSQTVGAFDVFLNEKLSSIWHAYRGLFITSVSSTFHRVYARLESREKPSIFMRIITLCLARKMDESDCLGMCLMEIIVGIAYTLFWIVVSFAKAAVQALLLLVILLPVATLYIFGLYMSTSISLWRLIQHDYGDDGGANMKPALNVLYSLVVIQGLVFCYKIIFARQDKSMVVFSTEKWGDEHDDGALAVTWDYLRETKMGCEKDPSFARGRNLITYAMDLIESRSPANYLAGTRVVNMLLNSYEHGSLIRQLIACGGSSYVLQKLFGTLGPRSPYCGETRGYATNIVAHLASHRQIRLAQFPGGIQCISSMLEDLHIKKDTSGIEDLQKRNEYTSQVEDGLRILEHLANDEGNRIIMKNTLGLLSSIMAPLGGFHRDGGHCHAWAHIAGVISQLLVAAPGEIEEIGLKLRREISHNGDVVGALESILTCAECDPQYRIKANDILADLFNSFTARKEENLIGILVDNFIHVNREDPNTHSRVDFAGSQLVELSKKSKSSAKLILRANDAVAPGLITIVENKARGSGSAEEILNNLCNHYSKDDECFDRLKKALINGMTKVLTEMLPQLGQGIRAETEAQNNIVLSAPGEELEIVCESQENARNRKIGEGHKLKKKLKFFCLLAKICNKLMSADDQDLSRQFDDIIAVMDSVKPVRTFASLVEEAQEALKEVKA
ncbi:uncharacterized protein LOC119288248 [Triticum dicoccoides]|uniref:uncharacterized protein LOC119288248 n=1 Tax=Triticum dicoccoides TaxID=85692 RepID=UPI000E7AD20F|nr:uncharacterized protein LOC119288248 [Triticum dicoccoides]